MSKDLLVTGKGGSGHLSQPPASALLVLVAVEGVLGILEPRLASQTLGDAGLVPRMPRAPSIAISPASASGGRWVLGVFHSHQHQPRLCKWLWKGPWASLGLGVASTTLGDACLDPRMLWAISTATSIRPAGGHGGGSGHPLWPSAPALLIFVATEDAHSPLRSCQPKRLTGDIPLLSDSSSCLGF